MDRYWLLTWTTYGTWLPGDARGSVSSVRAGAGPRQEHDQPGSPVDPPMPGLEAASRERMKGAAVYLSRDQAVVLLAQLRETAAYRGWGLAGAALMSQHLHLVVGVPGDPEPETLVRDFKSYGSRALNQRWGKPANGSWWAGGGGSRRKLPDPRAVAAALGYLRRQEYPLALWFPEGEPGASAPGGGASPPGADAPGSPA